uniref:hypothetical protein n=1 Tax=Paractinoplanes polyasparticus TaxID=2856853 RepID=UPI001C84A439|nr:hypothetical protein [Actinoplanes polyasparticus]
MSVAFAGRGPHVADSDVLAAGFAAELTSPTGTGESSRHAVRDFVRQSITGLFDPPAQRAGRENPAHDAFLERWDEVLYQGIHGAVDGRLVWVRPVIGALTPVPTPPGPRVFKVSFGSRAINHSGTKESSGDHEASIDGSFGRLGEHITRLIPYMPAIGVGSSVESSASSQRRLVAGRQMFILNSQQFDAGLSFEVHVDGRLWGRTREYPPAGGLLTVVFPTEYTEPGTGDTDSPAAGPQRAATPLTRRRPTRAHEVVNAFAMTPIITAWHRALVRSMGAAKALPLAEQGVKQLLNERAVLNRNRMLMTGGDHEGGLAAGGTWLTLDLTITPRTLGSVGTSPNVAVRDDLGIVAATADGQEGSSRVSVDFRVFGYGLTHLDPPSEPKAKDERRKGVFGGGVEVGSVRASGSEHGSETLNHTVLRRQSDQARYWMTFDATLRTSGNGQDVEDVHVVDLRGEVAVPEAEKGDFEQSTIGTDVLPGHEYPASRPAVTPPAAPTSDADVDRRLGAPLPTAPQSRTRFPATPEPTEPLPLVTRRGLGAGVPVGLPGSEAVAKTITGALRTASGTTDIGAEVVSEINARAGRPALEADFGRVQAGDPFTVTIGGQQYDVLVLAHLREHIGETSYQIDVNQRALHGNSFSGSLTTDRSVEASLGGAVVLALPGGVRLQLGRAEAGAAYSTGHSNEYSDTIKHYRRTETTGDVTEHTYNVVYEIVVRPQGGARSTYLIDDPDRAVGQIAVPVEHAARTPVTQAQRDTAGWAAVRTTPPPGWTGDSIPFDTQGASGTYPFFLTMPEVVAGAAQAYADLNGLDAAWFAEPLNWPRPLWSAGVPAELAAHFAEISGPTGWVIPLPDRDGRRQVVLIRTRIDQSPRHLGASMSTEIEHYVQSAPGQQRSDTVEKKVDGKVGAGVLAPMVRADTTDPEGPTKRAAGSGGAPTSGSTVQDTETFRINAGISGGAEKSWSSSKSTEFGNIDITRATYGQTVHAFRGTPTFEIEAFRFTGEGNEGDSVSRYVTVTDGVDFIVPNRQAHELGLPNATPIEPNETPGREIIDARLTRAVGHPERVTADTLVLAIINELSSHGLLPPQNADGQIPPTPLGRALVERFSDAALESQYLALTGSGILMWVPVVAPYSPTRYLMVRVKATPQAPSSDLPRDEVSLTLRGEQHDARSVKHEHGADVHAEGGIRARGAVGDGDLGGEFQGGWHSGSQHSRGEGVEVKDIFRVGVKKSHEFNQPLIFNVELGVTHEKPEIFRVISEAARETAFAVTGGAATPRKLWYGKRVFHWDWTSSRSGGAGYARMLVPSYLTLPTGTSGRWQPTAAPVPAADQLVRWHTAPPAATRNQTLLDDETLHPWTLLPVSEAITKWAAVVAEPPIRRPDDAGLTRPDAAEVPGRGPHSGFGLTVARHATDSMLRPRIGQMLRHDYTIPGTDIRVGLDIRNECGYQVPDGDAHRPLTFEHKGRTYQQTAQTPSHENSSGSGWQFSGGLLGRGGADGGERKVGTSQVPGLGWGRGSAYEATSSSVAERNSEAKRSYYLYRYDVTLVLYGSSGDPLRIDLDEAFFAGSGRVPATSPAMAGPRVEERPSEETGDRRLTPPVETRTGIELGTRIDVPPPAPPGPRVSPFGSTPPAHPAPASSPPVSPYELLTQPAEIFTPTDNIELSDLSGGKQPWVEEHQETPTTVGLPPIT